MNRNQRFLALVLVTLVILVPAAGAANTQQSSTVAPTNATVETAVHLDTSHVSTSTAGSPNNWKRSPDDKAAFYGANRDQLYYYNATSHTLHSVARVTALDFIQNDNFLDIYAGNPAKWMQPGGAAGPTYTDRETIAFGTTIGPLIYDVETHRWTTHPNNTIGGYPTITNTPGAVATAGKYYVNTAWEDLYLATENWTNHVASPPPEFTTKATPSYLTSTARFSSYSRQVSKTGFPIIFRGAIGRTDREPDEIRGSPAHPIWNPPNEELTPFAASDTITTTYDGASPGTVVIRGSNLVSYNVTTGEPEWQRNGFGHRTTRHNHTWYTENRMLDLVTGNATSLYRDGQSSHHTTRVNGTSVGGNFDRIESVSADGDYLALTMVGQSTPAKYRSSGLRVVNTSTRTITTQRITRGRYDDRWEGMRYLVDLGNEYGAILSAPSLYEPDRPIQVIDLSENKTTAEFSSNPGNVGGSHNLAMQVTENDLVLIPHLGDKQTSRHYTVFDAARNETLGDLSVPLTANESISSVHTRQGELYVFTNQAGTTNLRVYGGLDDSLAVQSDTHGQAVEITATTLDGRSLPNTTVHLAEQTQETNATGTTRFTLDPPAEPGTKTYDLTVQTSAHTLNTTVTVSFTETNSTTNQESTARTITNTTNSPIPGFTISTALLALALTILTIKTRCSYK